MSTEDLLLPRYKVIADYPYNNYHKIGSVLTDDGIQCVRDENGKSVFAVDFIKFPHIFKKLEWWEERKVEDMPGYVKVVYAMNKDEGECVKVYKWDVYEGLVSGISYKEGGGTLIDYLLPITEQEYNEYQKQNQ